MSLVKGRMVRTVQAAQGPAGEAAARRGDEINLGQFSEKIEGCGMAFPTLPAVPGHVKSTAPIPRPALSRAGEGIAAGRDGRAGGAGAARPGGAAVTSGIKSEDGRVLQINGQRQHSLPSKENGRMRHGQIVLVSC